MNFYKRHIGDYLKDTAHLSLLEHGVYGRLLDVYYTRESGIPDDQAARLIGARGKEECSALKIVLAEFFELVDGTWVQDRCEREIQSAGPKPDHEGEDGAKSSRATRQQRYRERRKAMFDALRERGVTMPWDASMEQLQDALLRVTDTSRVTTPVTPETHNVTATISQTPDSRLQKPIAAHTAFTAPTHEDRQNALPEFESTLTPEQKAAVPVVTKLRSLGVAITSANPLAAEWVAKGLTVDRAVEVVEFARLKGDKANGPIHPNFINALIDDALNPRKPRPKAETWWLSNESMNAKAREIGIAPARPGEEPGAFKARIQQALNAKEAA